MKKKTKLRPRPQGKHGKIRRIVNSGVPLKSLYEAQLESLLCEKQEMLDAAVQSLDTACAVRDLTEQARRELLDALQKATTRIRELEAKP